MTNLSAEIQEAIRYCSNLKNRQENPIFKSSIKNIETEYRENINSFMWESDLPDHAGDFFKLCTHAAKDCPGWFGMGFLSKTNSSSRFQPHDKIHTLAVKAPQEFAEFAAASIANASYSQHFITDILIYNKQALNLSDSAIAQIINQSIETEPQSVDYNKNNLRKEMFGVLMNRGNEAILEHFIDKNPENFGKLVMAATKGEQGWEAIAKLGHLNPSELTGKEDLQGMNIKEKGIIGRQITDPSVQKWIDENPETYEKAAIQAIIGDNSLLTAYDQQSSIEVQNLMNKSFLKKHPQFEQKAQNACIANYQKNLAQIRNR